jgi:hypothetical protein
VIAAAGAGVGLLVVLRVWRRRRHRVPEPPPSEAARWFGRLLAVLAAHGYAPDPAETPREFAARVGDQLGYRTAAALGGVPAEWAEAYYQERYGGVPVPAGRRAELETRLEELRQALARG